MSAADSELHRKKLTVRVISRIDHAYGQEFRIFWQPKKISMQSTVFRDRIQQFHLSKYPLEQEDKTKDEELYWNKETSRTVEVRGYFNVLEKRPTPDTG